MNFRKLGIVLFLVMCIAGFTLSSVNAQAKDVVEHNKLYIPQDLNVITQGSENAQDAWVNLLNNYWFIEIKSDGKTFESGANRRDKDGILLKSNVGYIVNRVGYSDQVFEGGYHYITDCRETGLETYFRTDHDNTITGYFDRKITNVLSSPMTVVNATFNDKNYKIKINRYAVTGDSVKVVFALEDGTNKTFNIGIA
jgi:hypothetical protein